MKFSMDLSEKRPDFHPNSRRVELELGGSGTIVNCFMQIRLLKCPMSSAP